MRKHYLTLLSLLFLVCACSLSASQEQELNKQTGIYLDAKETNSMLMLISKTHPSFVKYAKSKGNDYFKQAFEGDQLEQLIYIDPRIMSIEKKGEVIQVLYEIEKEYILDGENKRETVKVVALSENAGELWFFMDYSAYSNKNICKDIPRLIK